MPNYIVSISNIDEKLSDDNKKEIENILGPEKTQIGATSYFVNSKTSLEELGKNLMIAVEKTLNNEHLFVFKVVPPVKIMRRSGLRANLEMENQILKSLLEDAPFHPQENVPPSASS